MIVNPFNNLIDDLQFLELWEAHWCLKFNIDKCMVMQIGSCNHKNQYLFGGVPLRCVDSEKDLGVTFNTSFNFKDHVRNSIAKANRTIGHSLGNKKYHIVGTKRYAGLVQVTNKVLYRVLFSGMGSNG